MSVFWWQRNIYLFGYQRKDNTDTTHDDVSLGETLILHFTNGWWGFCSLFLILHDVYMNLCNDSSHLGNIFGQRFQRGASQLYCLTHYNTMRAQPSNIPHKENVCSKWRQKLCSSTQLPPPPQPNTPLENTRVNNGRHFVVGWYFVHKESGF